MTNKHQGVCTAQILEEGRITISAPVRRQLTLSKGDLVRVDVEKLEGER